MEVGEVLEPDDIDMLSKTFQENDSETIIPLSQRSNCITEAPRL